MFKSLLDELPKTWNASGAIKKFYNERVQGASLSSNTTIALDRSDEWMYFYAVRMVIGSDNELDWYPENLGSFFIDWLLYLIQSVGIKTEDKVSLVEQLDAKSHVWQWHQ